MGEAPQCQEQQVLAPRGKKELEIQMAAQKGNEAGQRGRQTWRSGGPSVMPARLGSILRQWKLWKRFLAP